MLALATTRSTIANYVDALFTVYIVLLFVYLLVNLMLSFGVRPSYSRWVDAVLGFLRDIAEPYLRVFRRLVPTMGGFDFTPMIAIIVLYVLRTIVVNAIAG
jgi:YggT family protein